MSQQGLTNSISRSILIVDDEVHIARLLSHHLRKTGYQPIETNSPEEALQVLESIPPDLVLCDVTMEGMDGFDFCRLVRSNPLYKNLPFIFITGNSSEEIKAKATEAGGDDFIVKPFNVKELSLKIEALFRRMEILKTYGATEGSEDPETRPMVLLVDDDKLMLQMFKYNLERENIRVEVAYDVNGAFEVLKNIKPQIIVSDIMMPGLSGFEFREKILQIPDLKDIPFIFLTAKGAEDDMITGFSMGVTDYIVKTAGPKVLILKIRALLSSLIKERRQGETEIKNAADSFQLAVVPSSFPVFPGYDIKHWHKPFKGIPGGDFLDYHRIDDHRFLITLGDVMGKKWGAWYFAVAYAGYIRSSIRMILQHTKTASPGEILAEVNKAIANDAKISEIFTTLSVISIDSQSNEVSYSGAGDLPLVLLREDGTHEMISSEGILLGFDKDADYKSTVTKLNPNDTLILMTDGILESVNSEGKPFGESGLEKALDTIQKQNDKFLSFQKEFTLFTQGNFDDDVTLVTVTLGS